MSRVLRLLDVAESISAAASVRMPPVSDDAVHNFLANLVARHTRLFERFDTRVSGRVIRQAATRYSRDFRAAHYNATDHFVYWPAEVHTLAEWSAELRSIEYIRKKVKALLEWGVKSSMQEILDESTFPGIAYRRPAEDLWAMLADARPRAGEWPKNSRLAADGGSSISGTGGIHVSDRSVTVICARLNAHTERCRIHLKGDKWEPRISR